MKSMMQSRISAWGLCFVALWLLPPAADSVTGSQSRVHVTVGFAGYFGVPAYYGYGGYYYPSIYPPGVVVPPPTRPYYAFVDTDIHPEKASVYLDGKLIGIADDFDGYPGYLALKPGRHTLLFLREGYHSLSFKLDLHSGEMIDLDRKLPEVSPGESEEAPPTAVSGPGQGKSPSEAPEEDIADGSKEPQHGTLRLEVAPPTARVILDGDFFGTGAEISRLHGGIPLSPGTHRIRVSLEGYKSAAVETEIAQAEGSATITLLKKGKRSRVAELIPRRSTQGPRRSFKITAGRVSAFR